ncbi:MAG: GNAT family N-acetyltransferase [Candidatus Cloacimonetes bacterium]|nr:GNAT family N-acetyltransferase [Candidatus Cloacimonadota bacterium]MBS3766745.1 GNAT family N-acetyltransferase [Candidatus Cloacimonadota bacterium]
MIAKITCQAKKEYLPEILDFIIEISSKQGIAVADKRKLRLVVEEAAMNVIQHAFPEYEAGSFDIIVSRQPGKIEISVEDRGLPFDFNRAAKNTKSGVGIMLMKAFADEVEFSNLGRRGKSIKFIKNLEYKNIKEYQLTEQPKSVGKAPKDVTLQFRMLEEKDSVGVARCMYRSYGYTYGKEFVYYPEKVKEMIKSGQLHSSVVLSPEGEIIGHLALLLDKPNSKVGETGMAIVDPRFRGRGLFKRMKLYLADYAKDRGMYGIYSEAVAVHPYTQKGNISLGANETGFLIAFTPVTMHFKKIDKQKRTKRETTVLFYYKIAKEPTRKVYPPFHHKSIIAKIFQQNNLSREICKINKKKWDRTMAEKTQIEAKIQKEPARAFLKILEYGNDFEDMLSYRLKELCVKKIECIYVDLPLSNSLTQIYCAKVEKLGFFFAGIIPELYNGDYLRMQYLNNVEPNLENVTIVSDFGKDLFEYVVSTYEEME